MRFSKKQPVSVYIAPHPLLRIVREDVVQDMKQNDTMIVEWSDQGDKTYKKFITDLNMSLYKIEVPIPDITNMIMRAASTGDYSEFHPYEKEKARQVTEYVRKNNNKKLGLIIGQAPWEFTQELFEKKRIPYQVKLFLPLW